MNIFIFTETHSGCYKWRGAIPAKYLRRRGHTVQIFSDKSARSNVGPDAIIFAKTHFAEAKPLVEWCKKNSVRVVFDTDDALDLVQPENLNYAGLQQTLPAYEFLLKEADVVTTTTDTLAAHLRNWNPNVAVIPNSVDADEWTPKPRGDGVRIGWTGSPTHFADLPIALDVVRDLQKKYPFTVVLQGICLEPSLEALHDSLLRRRGKQFFQTPVGKSFKKFLEKLSGIRYEFHPSVPIEDHARKVCDLALDIGIAPLLDDRFNRNKSCIKYYEYAMSGAVTVASRVLPYSTEVPITAKNKREAWTQQLEFALTTNRDSLWREQRDWVLTNRNIETTAPLWEQACAKRGQARISPPLRNSCLSPFCPVEHASS